MKNKCLSCENVDTNAFGYYCMIIGSSTNGESCENYRPSGEYSRENKRYTDIINDTYKREHGHMERITDTKRQPGDRNIT